MKRVWVIGAGGMLGEALCRELSRDAVEIYRYQESFDWKDRGALLVQFDVAIQEFLSGLEARDCWEIYWAAGVGSMGSSQADLDGETAALTGFLVSLERGQRLCGASGFIGFSSSAGALYAASGDFETTEATPTSASNNYAAAKLAQEVLLEDFVSRLDSVRGLAARFSTLYGPGQAQGKRQGLLSHIARCALRHQPVEIFVPLDTSRDYLFVDDAARDFIDSTQGTRTATTRFHVKVIAAERSVTISEIVATFNRLNKRPLRVVCIRNNLSALYTSRVSYRSVSPLGLGKGTRRRTLLEGAAALLRAERAAYIAGPTRGPIHGTA